jgi:hypothetical protein
MTNSEKQKLMMGTKEDKKNLLDYLIANMGEAGLQPADIPMLEYLKTQLEENTQVLNMSASLNGQSGVNN